MTAISPSTQRRLQQLPQLSSVWEGDRRYVAELVQELELDRDAALDRIQQRRELIVWVDGIDCVVRSMEVVNATMGNEAIVRALIKAMESPQAPSQPARPQKIVVRDRQLQFYLRGVLQDLEIVVEYVPELPIVDELFQRFTDLAGARAPKLPRRYLESLKATAREIWTLAPWSMLADYEAISIELNKWDIEKFYVSVMGMLGMEYGVLLYRSLESLHRFRAMALNRDESSQMESAFLSQDCIFVTFDAAVEISTKGSDLPHDVGTLSATEIEPNFGNIHPMEGMRPFLYEEEAIATNVALMALKQFIADFRQQLDADELPSLSATIEVTIPDLSAPEPILRVSGTAPPSRSETAIVETLPELSQELLKMHLALGNDDEFDPLELQIREDLIPNDSFISLGMMPWDRVEIIRQSVVYHQSSEVQPLGEGLPIILIQTTRPKAREIIERIQQAGGLQGICFNPGEDPIAGDRFDLGILQLADDEMQLFGEFDNDSAVHMEARKKWHQRSNKTQGYCGLIVAQGLTGKARGNPGIRETIAFLETKSLADDDLGLGTLQLMRHFD
ncbi:hypothetical protein [Chamaesiphon sp. GL140_3_metabinner_50]|uniref:DUF6930 domain-containing protein n=1 Tax=Chamaesiphon sp. GL140_3_metabinner_50 TaxID=2970812 RepID=UPI0025F1B671|nr:hypothetical protein [Chamaesiphon sp. GL140_3_metabinner_50]